jgi:hypothetical protein
LAEEAITPNAPIEVTPTQVTTADIPTTAPTAFGPATKYQQAGSVNHSSGWQDVPATTEVAQATPAVTGGKRAPLAAAGRIVKTPAAQLLTQLTATQGKG